MKSKLIIICILMIPTLGCISDGESEFKKKRTSSCVMLTESANNLFNEWSINRDKIELVDSILALINKAIDCDSIYSMNYSLKFNILRETKRVPECIETLLIMEKISPSIDGSQIAHLAQCYYLIGEMDSFDYRKNQAFQLAKEYHDKKKDYFSFTNLLALTTMLDGAEAAREIVEQSSYIQLHPEKKADCLKIIDTIIAQSNRAKQ